MTSFPTPQPQGDEEASPVYDDGNGTRISVSSDGNHVELSLPAITSVGLLGLQEVASHTINRVFGSTSHVVHFVNGGYARLSHTDGGELLEFDGFHVRIEVDKAGRMLVGACLG
jgi:hypothetical protein